MQGKCLCLQYIVKDFVWLPINTTILLKAFCNKSLILTEI